MASEPSRSTFGLTRGERSPASKANPLGVSNTAEVLQTIGRADRLLYAPGNPPVDLGPIRTLGQAGQRGAISPIGRVEVGGGI